MCLTGKVLLNWDDKRCLAPYRTGFEEHYVNWHQSGLSTPADPCRLAQENSQLQQQVIDLRLQLEERDQDLAAARSANRELMAQLSHAMRRG